MNSKNRLTAEEVDRIWREEMDRARHDARVKFWGMTIGYLMVFAVLAIMVFLLVFIGRAAYILATRLLGG